MKNHTNLFFFIVIIFFYLSNFCSTSSTKTSIIFTTLGRSSYNFDIYTLPITLFSQPTSKRELKLTDGVSVNYNGYFPNSTSSSIFSLLETPNPHSSPHLQLVYVTERNGTFDIYLDSIYVPDSLNRPGARSSLELQLPSPSRVQLPLLGLNKGTISMKDRPSLVSEDLIYVSTHQDPGLPRASWAAVYLTHIPTGLTRRLTPEGVADFSPAVSPSGAWTAVASYGVRGWSGEVKDLGTDIYIFMTRTGLNRVKVVEHGGWPCWVDDETFFFHRRNADDGWWSVYKASITRVERLGSIESVVIERVTPPGLHAFTPATSPGNKRFIALATRRPGSDYRHIELFDLKKRVFIEMTRPVSPNANHLNPFISTDSTRIGYHKCRGEGDRGSENPIDHLFLENLETPESEISFFRVDGSFPSFSPTGDRIAYVNLPGVYVVNSDGSNRREVFKGMAFPTAWDPIRKGVVYTSVGPTFASESTDVDVISINVDEENPSYKKLTQGGENNAFPSPSPDGKWVVFRSGRSGHKNLYIMDALEGEIAAIHRLTEGSWSDTMANWSPDGEWIAFASDRENPDGGSFELFMIHPNGTGLRKVIQSGMGGRANHPCFSPDGKSITFTSDYAGVSAEPISNPHSYQPYGEIFIANVDGSRIRRMTHNSYEDGTPAWGHRFLSPEDIARPPDEQWCDFADCHWLNIESNSAVKAQC